MAGSSGGKLDDISFKIGSLEAVTTALARTFRDHCTDDDRRHEENKELLRAIEGRLAEMARKTIPVIPATGGLPRKVIAAAATAGFLIFSASIWAAQEAGKFLLGWVFSHFH